MTEKTRHIASLFGKRRDIWVGLLLVMVTLAVYGQVYNYDFIALDDNLYYTENCQVQEGFTLEGITWSLTNTDVGMWIPMVWISYMAGSQFFGVSPGGHHLVNVFLHLANILLLFFLLKRLTGDLWPSAFVAALFALHPLHVESVVWITERKDVLSTFFFLLTIWGYCRYIDRPTAGKYLLMLMFFALGLMAKPMIVTLPLVLLLLDYWPLKRYKLQPFNGRNDTPRNSGPLYLIFEKIPFFILAAVAGVVTIIANRKLGAIGPLEALPLNFRIANALVVYVAYIGKMIWPAKLAVLYPHPETVPWWQAVGAFGLLASSTFLVCKNAQQRPYLLVGWFWYLGTLMPVIGLVQVGIQSMADRFVYVPLIGLYLCIAWGAPSLFAQLTNRNKWLTALAAALLLAFTLATWKQIRYWKDSVTLFEHTLNVTSNNWLLHNNLGVALEKEGRLDDAVGHYLEALRIKPDYAGAHNNLGVVLANQGRLDEAVGHYLETLRLEPEYVDAHNNLGVALAKQDRLDEAIDHYLDALRLQPDYAVARSNLGVALAKKGRLDEAINHHLAALRLKADYAEAHYNLAVVLAQQGRLDEAVGHYLNALRIKPDYAGAHTNLGVVLVKQGRIDEAVRHYLEALRINPDHVEARFNLGNALADQGRMDQAISQYLETLRLQPDYEKAHTNLGIALIGEGEIEEAIYHFREALRIHPDDVNASDNLKRALICQKQGDK